MRPTVTPDQAQFEALIAQYGGYIHAIVQRVCGQWATREDVEDCAADVLVSLWRTRDQFDPHRGDARHYIAAAARNRAITLRERLSRAPFLPLDEDILALDAPDDADQRELAHVLNEAIDTLDPPDPEIFRRRYHWGDSLDDIAQALNLTVRAVEGRLHRGRKRLKVYLEGRL